jgi:predicted  nucleic acid-binding Zn-ribbon protein
MTTDFVESESHNPESIFEPRKYRVTYRCQQCGHQWKSGWRKSVPKKDPPCPSLECAEVTSLRQMKIENDRLRAMLAEQRAPAQIGTNKTVAAVDQTANIVMQDYGLTDLKDGIRPGETMAPKLPQQQQALADTMFNGGTRDVKVKDALTGRMETVQAAQMNRIGKRAIAGVYRGMSVAPNAVIPERMRHQSPLQLVRTEKPR